MFEEIEKEEREKLIAAGWVPCDYYGDWRWASPDKTSISSKEEALLQLERSKHLKKGS